jgi:hypothetical protein
LNKNSSSEETIDSKNNYAPEGNSRCSSIKKKRGQKLESKNIGNEKLTKNVYNSSSNKRLRTDNFQSVESSPLKFEGSCEAVNNSSEMVSPIKNKFVQ